MPTDLLTSDTFWVAVATGIFFAAAIFWLKVHKILASGLDKRAEGIKSELDEAVKLKEEAQALLASCQRKQKKALEESEEIIAHAKQEAERIIVNAKEKLEADVKKRTELALTKIENSEAQVIQEIRDNAVDITIGAARTIITEHLDAEAAEELVGAAISDLDRKFH